MRTITCKLPEKLNSTLESISRQSGLSKSELVRQALEQRFLKRRASSTLSVFELAKDFSGILEGPADLLTNTRHMEGFGA